MNKKTKKLLLIGASVVFLGSSIVSVGYALGNYNIYKICNKSYDDLSDLEKVDFSSDECPGSDVNLVDLSKGGVASVPNSLEQMNAEEADLTAKGVNMAQYQAQYDNLRNLNQDYVGWLNIPNTTINYPVCYDGNNEYYLHHDFYGNSSIYGCLFVDRRCTCPFYDKNTIIYGHHMRNGSMFGNLSKYKDSSYLANHQYIKVASRNRVFTYKIFSVFSEELCERSYTTDFSTLGSFVDYCNYLKGKSMYPIDAGSFQINDRTLVLSTCSYETDHSRFLVCAKLVK